jgi:hypothetical protein
MADETARVHQDIAAATQRIASDNPDHKPPQPEVTGAESLAHATKYAKAIVNSAMRDRTAK